MAEKLNTYSEWLKDQQARLEREYEEYCKRWSHHKCGKMCITGEMFENASHYFKEFDDYDKRKYLESAIKNNKFDIVKFILQHFNENYRAFLFATDKGNIEILKKLLELPETTGNDINWGLEQAVNNGNIEIVDLLLNHPKQDFSNIRSYFESACTFSNMRTYYETAGPLSYIEIVKLFLNTDKIPKKVIHNCLQGAITHNNITLVEILLASPKCDPSCIASRKKTKAIQLLYEEALYRIDNPKYGELAKVVN